MVWSLRLDLPNSLTKSDMVVLLVTWPTRWPGITKVSFNCFDWAMVSGWLTSWCRDTAAKAVEQFSNVRVTVVKPLMSRFILCLSTGVEYELGLQILVAVIWLIPDRRIEKTLILSRVRSRFRKSLNTDNERHLPQPLGNANGASKLLWLCSVALR